MIKAYVSWIAVCAVIILCGLMFGGCVSKKIYLNDMDIIKNRIHELEFLQPAYKALKEEREKDLKDFFKYYYDSELSNIDKLNEDLKFYTDRVKEFNNSINAIRNDLNYEIKRMNDFIAGLTRCIYVHRRKGRSRKI